MALKPPKLDSIDLKILNHLQKEGRAQRNTISEIVDLSVPSVSDRMNKLEASGHIQGYAAKLDSKKFHFDITAFVFVEVDGSDNYSGFVDEASNEDQILECHSVTGDGSHLLKICTENTLSFEKLLSKIQSWKGVKKTRSNVVLNSYKESQAIPVELTIDPKK
jgi:Lrp/AsnC family leucine-responsive transcriptional regulator